MVYRYAVYKVPKIGIFVKPNGNVIHVQRGFDETKPGKLADDLQVRQRNALVVGTRLTDSTFDGNNSQTLTVQEQTSCRI